MMARSSEPERSRLVGGPDRGTLWSARVILDQQETG